MTEQEAKNILSENWWSGFPNSYNLNEDRIILGEVAGVTPADDPDYPDSFLVDTHIVKNNESKSDDNFVQFAVSKIDGSCRPAIRLYK